MDESKAGKVCPYCEGKGYALETVELFPDVNRRDEQERTPWTRKPCPLCDGKGHISCG